MRRAVAALVALVALAALLSARGAVAGPVTPVQDRFAAPGPSAVVHVPLPDSSGAVPFELYRPGDLGPPGTLHPLVTWGNGSFARPAEYDPFLRHLASWGFVVIASTHDQVGTGEEQLAGVRRAQRLAEDPTDPLFGHLDLDHVAASGHSQGGGGSVRAALAPDSPITTLLTFDLPNELFRFDSRTKGFDTAAIRVPVLFLTGSQDELISGAAANRGYFDSVPGPAGVALLTGADHNGIQHGARPYPGYATAWLRYQLMADPVAATAFSGPRPELLTAPGWQGQALKGLVPPPPFAPSAAGPTTTAPPELPRTGRAATHRLGLAAALAALALRRIPSRQ
jgi:hypothetical protein